jgi:hypothetical protein
MGRRALPLAIGAALAAGLPFAAPRLAFAGDPAGAGAPSVATASAAPALRAAPSAMGDVSGSDASLADLRLLSRGPTLPDLTHAAAEGSFEQVTASVIPKGGGEPLGSHVFHGDVELPIAPWLFLGGSYGAAVARAASSDPTGAGGASALGGKSEAHFVSAQPEAWARVVHQGLGASYTLGAGLGVVPPLVTYGGLDDEQRLAQATASSLVGILRPWDVPLFLDRRLTLRPWIDLRTTRKHLVAQFRGRMDFSLRTSRPLGLTDDQTRARVGELDLFASAALYLGWRPTREVTLGLEAWEVYLLKTPLPLADRDRVTFALSPSVRLHFRWVEPAVSVLLPLGRPLFGVADSYVAVRVDVRVWFERPPM